MKAAGGLTALGLMSGTSMDGIDAAIVTTDGERILSTGPWATYLYERHAPTLAMDQIGAGDTNDITIRYASDWGEDGQLELDDFG